MNWQPIETAPRDGTPILGFDGKDFTTVRWEQYGHEGSWDLCVCGSHAENVEWWPNYWMPLPEPPEVK